MLRVYVAHDSGAELLSLAERGCDAGESSSGHLARDARDALASGAPTESCWEGMNSGQVCALLSSFALFEEDQGLRTRVEIAHNKGK